jgi:very-short-patch-repair endonuclease
LKIGSKGLRRRRIIMRHRTDIEILMADALEEHDIDAVEQWPIRSKHGYILDFGIPELKIDIECDGEVWHREGNSRDRKRNWVLRNRGWKVIRFRGNEIKNEIEECMEKIKLIINERRVVLHED